MLTSCNAAGDTVKYRLEVYVLHWCFKSKNMNKPFKDRFRALVSSIQGAEICLIVYRLRERDNIHARQVHHYHKTPLSLHSNTINSKEVSERQQVGHSDEQLPASGDRGQSTLNVTCADDACTAAKGEDTPVSESNQNN